MKPQERPGAFLVSASVRFVNMMVGAFPADKADGYYYGYPSLYRSQQIHVTSNWEELGIQPCHRIQIGYRRSILLQLKQLH